AARRASLRASSRSVLRLTRFHCQAAPGGAGDERFQLQFDAQIMDPAGLRAGFEDDLGDRLAGEFLAEFVGRSANGAEGRVLGAGFVPAENGVELAQVDGENGRGHACLRLVIGAINSRYTRAKACMDSFGEGDVSCPTVCGLSR